MHGSKTQKIFLNDAGEFLGRGEGCLVVRDRKRQVRTFLLFENKVSEVQIKMGNSVLFRALATCALLGNKFLITTQRGNPVAYLKSIEDDSQRPNQNCSNTKLSKMKKLSKLPKKLF